MISVVIPMYNAKDTILNCLYSVITQDFDLNDFEIIIVNDGSTDNSKEIVEKQIIAYPNLKIILINQMNGGVSKARNAGLQRAEGEYVALLDSDDEWYREKTKHMMNVLKNEMLNVDFLACRRKNQRILYPYIVRDQNLASISFRNLMIRNEAQPSTVIFKKTVLENTGYFDGQQKYAEDLNYWLKVSYRNRMFILNEELVIAGSGKRTFGVSGLSANLLEMEKGFQKNLREMLFLKRINIPEYILYFIFYKFKYIVRIGRHKFLKLISK